MSGLAPLAAEKTREVFWGFSRRSRCCGTSWRRSRCSSLPTAWPARSRSIGAPMAAAGRPPPSFQAAFREALRILLSHVSIKRRDPYAGWAHRGIFYGFVVLFIGTVILGINTDFTEPVLGWRFFQGNFYLGYSIVLDVLGMALLAGLVLMMIRRGILRPRKLDYARPDRDTDERIGPIASATGCSSASCSSWLSPATCSRACGSRWTSRVTTSSRRRAGRLPRASMRSARATARCAP